MSNEKLLAHMQQLQERHDLLDREITYNERSHRNQTIIIDLKKKKLKLKDEIEALKKQL